MTPRRHKIVLVTALGAIGLALIITGFYLAGEVKHIALRRVTAAVDSALHEPYRLELTDFRVRLVDGMIAFPGFRIVADSAALARMEVKPRTLYTIECGHVEVYIRRERRKVLEIRSVRIVDPHVVLHVDRGRPASVREEGNFSLPFDAVKVGRITISGGRLAYDSLTVDGLALQIDNLLIDSLFHRMSTPPHFDDLRLSAARLRHPGPAYTLDIHGLALGTKARSARLDSLALEPRYPRQTFAANTLTDWMALGTGALSISGLNYEKLLARQAFEADSIAVASLRIASYKNRQVRQPRRLKPLFHQSLQRLPIPVSVARIALSGGHAQYDELPATGSQAGTIRFEQIDAHIDSLTNRIDAPHDYYTLDATARIYGTGAVTLHADFPVDSLHDHFAMHGSLGGMPLAAFDPMTRPLGHLGIHTGQLRGLYFNLEGDSHNGLITMRMEYDSLRVDLLNRQGEVSWLGSALANGLLLHDANPMSGHEVRRVQATAARDPYRSHFNYLWRMLFAGIKPSVGLNEQEQQAVSTLQAKLDQLKERHRERKARRAARRESRK